MLERAPIAAALLLALAAVPLSADVWDEGGDPDNTLAGTPDNELWHGALQVHDLGALPGPAADADHYGVFSAPYHSYEALVIGTTGDLNNGGAPDFRFDRYNGSTLVPELRAAEPVDLLPLDRVGDRIATRSRPTCGWEMPRAARACTAADQYTIRLLDTTYSIPRFNNSSAQVTTLLIQNTGSATREREDLVLQRVRWSRRLPRDQPRAEHALLVYPDQLARAEPVRFDPHQPQRALRHAWPARRSRSNPPLASRSTPR